jgi:CheY-like chemotaxis protein
MARLGRILVVEDEALVRQIIVAELADAGYDVLEAADGAQAMAALTEPEPLDFLFTDIRLPGEMDGWAIAQAARAAQPHLRVLYATGYTPDAPRQVPESVLLLKPYRTAKVLEQLQTLAAPSND